MNETEVINEVKNAIEARYGEGAMLKYQLTKIEPKATPEEQPLYHLIVAYKDDEGVVHIDHDIYLFSTDGENFDWYNSNTPKRLNPPSPSSKPTFLELLMEKLDATDAIDYYEILAVNEGKKKARVFTVLSDGTEKTVIVWINKDGTLDWKVTTFTSMQPSE